MNVEYNTDALSCSIDASRFLAQSQTRMSAIREGRPVRQAPLFFSVADHLPDDHEHDQEVQDFYALKGSRRHVGAYSESVGEEDEEEEGTGLGESSDSIPDPRRNRARQSTFGMKARWERSSGSSSRMSSSTVTRSQTDDGKNRLDDVRLDESVRLDMDPERIDHEDMLSPEIPRSGPSRVHAPDGIAIDMPRSDSPSDYFQRSSSPPARTNQSKFMPTQTPAHEVQQPLSQSVPAPVAYPVPDPPIHDRFWKNLYLLSMCGMFATGTMSWLQTDEGKLSKLIDTVHTAIHSHIHLLAVDSVVAVGVSLLWMYLLRRFVKLLIYALLVSVPIILAAMSIWPLVQSYGGKWGGDSTQDRAMRWGSIVPAIMSVTWIWVAYRGRNAMGRAMGIIQLACKILGENPALILLSFATLLGTIIFTWIWVGMFQNVFLYGRVGVVKGKTIRSFFDIFRHGRVFNEALHRGSCILSGLVNLGYGGLLCGHVPLDHWSGFRLSTRNLCGYSIAVVLLPTRYPRRQLPRRHGRCSSPFLHHPIWHNLFLLLCRAHGPTAHPRPSQASCWDRPPLLLQLCCFSNRGIDPPSYTHVCRNPLPATRILLSSNLHHALH